MAASAALTAVAAAVGGTLALFSTTATDNQSTFSAAQICMKADRDAGDSIPGPMFYINGARDGLSPGKDGNYETTDDNRVGKYSTGVWAPGDKFKRTLDVRNGLDQCTRSMDVWLSSVQASVSEGDTDLVDQLTVTVYAPLNGEDAVVAQRPMSDFITGPVALEYDDHSRVLLDDGSNMQMRFEVAFSREATNHYQGMSLEVDFTVNAVQQKNNP